MSAERGECLVARDCNLELEKKMRADDGLETQLQNLSIQDKKKNISVEPADFVTLQSIRSSALARKTNTTTKFCRGGQSLFSDLINRSEDGPSIENVKEKEDKEDVKKIEKKDEKTEEKKEEGAKDEKKEDGKTSEKDENEDKKEEDEEDELISRGPVRTTRTPVAHHPYHSARTINYGAAVQSSVDDYSAYSAYGTGYECGAGAWQDSPSSTTSSSSPETYNSAESGYHSISPSITPTPSEAPSMTPDFIKENFREEGMPDGLVDFILCYSRQYGLRGQDGAPDASPPPHSAAARPPSADSNCGPADSPMSARSAPHCSPGAPNSGFTGRVSPASELGTSPGGETPPQYKQQMRQTYGVACEMGVVWLCKCLSETMVARRRRVLQQEIVRTFERMSTGTRRLIYRAVVKDPYAANELLTGLIDVGKLRGMEEKKSEREELIELLTRNVGSMMTTIDGESNDNTDTESDGEGDGDEYAPKGLTFQDADQDSLLHLVLYHGDFPKVYAIVEQAKKCGANVVDLKNRLHETAFNVAVIRRNPMVAGYLLENNSDPNNQPLRGNGDSALHYAASRGMAEMVRIICRAKRANVNMQNGRGMSPLHCAILTHGLFDEEVQQVIDNKEVIKVLLECGADPMQVRSSDGRTIAHMAAEKHDAAMFEHLGHHVSDGIMSEIMNKKDFNRESPVDVVNSFREKLPAEQFAMVFYAMMTQGASIEAQ